jgi:hypothetical protein
MTNLLPSNQTMATLDLFVPLPQKSSYDLVNSLMNPLRTLYCNEVVNRYRCEDCPYEHHSTDWVHESCFPSRQVIRNLVYE